MIKIHFTYKKTECSSCRCRDICVIPLSTLSAGLWCGARDTSRQAATDMHEAYWWCKEASKPALLDGSMMSVRLGKAGIPLTEQGAWESLFHQKAPSRPPEVQGNAPAETRQRGSSRQECSPAPTGHGCPPRWPGEHSSLQFEGGKVGSLLARGGVATIWIYYPSSGRGEGALSELPSPGQPGIPTTERDASGRERWAKLPAQEPALAPQLLQFRRPLAPLQPPAVLGGRAREILSAGGAEHQAVSVLRRGWAGGSRPRWDLENTTQATMLGGHRGWSLMTAATPLHFRPCFDCCLG